MTKIFPILLVMLASCGVFQKNATTSNEVTSNAAANPVDQFKNALILAVQKNSMDHIAAYLPDVAAAKRISPNETKDLPDNTIQTKMIDKLHGTLTEKLSDLHNYLIEKDVNVSSLKITNSKTEEVEQGEYTFTVLNLEVTDSDKSTKLGFFYKQFEEEIYLLDIILSRPVIHP